MQKRIKVVWMSKVLFSLSVVMLTGILLLASGCFQVIDQENYNPPVNPSSAPITGSPNKFISIITGADAGERFGSSVAPFTDVDGAGHPGIAVGAIASSPSGENNAGSVYVISFVNVQTRYRLDGQEAGDQFGRNLVMIGDLNNDKVSEFIVGAPTGDIEGITDAGYVGLFSGKDGKQLDLYKGATKDFQLGHSLAGLGDISGDGIPDFAIGTPYASNGGKLNTGVVIIEQSMPGSLNRQPLSIYGEADGDNFGWSIAGIGDVNGDRIPDIAVGAPSVKLANGVSVGRVYVLSGNGRTTLYKIDGTEPDERFGFSVVGIDDIDGDNVPDFAVGAPTVDLSDRTPPNPGKESAGKAYVFSGRNGNLKYKLEGFPQGSLFGFSLASGDVDDDGLADIMVGDPSAGQKHGSVHVFSGKNGESLYVFINMPTRKDEVGFAINCGNDLNNDGRADVIVGASGAPNIEAKPTGMVFVLNIP
jgi:hypothetical protein